MRSTTNKYSIKINIKYYFSLVKYNFLIYILINALVSLLDGIGIALFIPLITNIDAPSKTTSSSTAANTLHNILNSIGIQHSIIVFSVVILSIFIIKGFFRGVQVFYSAKIRYLIMNKIRLTLLNKISKMSFFGFSQQKAGTLVNLFSGEMPKLYANMTSLFFCIQAFIMGITYVLFATLIDWKFAIIIVIIVMLIRLSFKKINEATQNLSKSMTIKTNALNQNLIQLIANFKYLKATNVINRFSKKIENEIQNVEHENFKVGKLQSRSEALKEPLAIAAIIILLIIIEKNNSGNIEAFIVSLILVYKAVINFTTLNASMQTYYQTGGSVDSIKDLNNELSNFIDQNGGTKTVTSIDNIKLVDVKIEYTNSVILEKINLEIQKNQVVGIVGESGSGKTSIINQILGLNTPASGHVLINDTPLNFYTKDSISSKIGYITQEIVIFNDSFFNNVTLFEEKSNESLRRFWEATALASIKEFIENAELREDTILGEIGLLISGGQRQRIAIARELYKKPDLLIMDEATSALDIETEKAIMQNISRLKNECMMVIVAHRTSILRNADKLYLIEDKKIAAEGNFEHLKKISDSFRRISES